MQVQTTVAALKSVFKAKQTVEDISFLVAEEIEELWIEIYQSGLFSCEQLFLLNKYKDQDTASLALFCFYKKYIMRPEMDLFRNTLKSILRLTLSVHEDLENFIQRNLVYSDEKAAPIVQYEVQALLEITSLYEKQTEKLFKSLSCEIREGTGSRITATYNGVRKFFHVPQIKRNRKEGKFLKLKSS